MKVQGEIVDHGKNIPKGESIAGDSDLSECNELCEHKEAPSIDNNIKCLNEACRRVTRGADSSCSLVYA
jgi:hypothetical protein